MSARQGTAPVADADSRPARSLLLPVAAAVLAAYAAVVGTIAVLRPAASDEKAAAGAESSSFQGASALDAKLLNEQASKLREEIKDDVKKAIDEALERCAAVGQQAERARAEVAAKTEASNRKADELEKNARARFDPIDETTATLTKDVASTKAGLESLTAQVKVLEKRPAGVPGTAPAPGPAAPDPVAPPAPQPGATPPAPPPGPTLSTKERVKQAIADLSDTRPEKIFAAAVFLGQAGDLEAVDALVKVMKEHKDPFMRTPAAAALGLLHACDAVPALIEAFGDKASEVCTQAGQAFSAITGQDSGLSGAATKKDKNEAKAKWSKWWRENEKAIREKWNQPKSKDSPAPPDDPAMDGGN